VRSELLGSLAVQAINLAGWSFALLFLLTMRRSNGYRALYELLTGTRTVSLPRAAAGSGLRIPVTLPAATTDVSAEETQGWEARGSAGVGQEAARLEYGAFHVVGALGRSETATVWLGRDRDLERSSWIYVQADAGQACSERRLQVVRPTRPHWLQGGISADRRWDAFEAVFGSPLESLLGRPRGVSWEQGRLILADLARELAAALADGTLPDRLTLSQIWIDRSGRLKLLDAGLDSCQPGAVVGADPFAKPASTQREASTIEKGSAVTEQDGKVARAVTFFRETVAQGVSGQLLPGRVLEFIEQLNARPASMETLSWAVERLEELALEPAALTWDYRLAVLAVTASTEQAVYTTAAWALAAVAVTTPTHLSPGAQAALVVVPSLLLPAIAGFVFCGGPVFRLTGVQVRRSDGLPAGRWRCAWRGFWAWLPSTMGFGLMALAVSNLATAESANIAGDAQQATASALWMAGFSCGWTICFLIHVVGALVAVLNPVRGVQDSLARTMLAPR
jgi:hypothetical protein